MDRSDPKKVEDREATTQNPAFASHLTDNPVSDPARGLSKHSDDTIADLEKETATEADTDRHHAWNTTIAPVIAPFGLDSAST
ncbi:hypothetical protein LTS18_003357, partial [Coniosporium uncinatum]